MKISKKILLYFSSTVILLTTLSAIIIYFLFKAYREEDFQQKQKQKITYTIGLITQYNTLSEELSTLLDQNTIHDFFDEKMLIYDQQKILIHQSVDDLTINLRQKILNQLSPSNQWVETKEGMYDVVGMYYEKQHKSYYAISKAYDESGFDKLHFLRNTLIIITIFIAVIVLLISYYLSNIISKPINQFAAQLHTFDINKDQLPPLELKTSSYEIKELATKFNTLINSTNEAFLFQKHATQHISHELKTPIAVLVSELERAISIDDTDEKNRTINTQVIKAKYLGDTINALLTLSKIDAGQSLFKNTLRADELIFQLLEEATIIYPDVQFEISFLPDNFEESQLTLEADRTLLRQAFANLLDNAIKYSTNQKVIITFDCSTTDTFNISFTNTGKTIPEQDKKYLFHHFFRGQYHASVEGFGLGLVLAQRIMHLHQAVIMYTTPAADKNVFTVQITR